MNQYWDKKTKSWRTRKPAINTNGEVPDVSGITGRIERGNGQRDSNSRLLNQAAGRASAMLDDDEWGIDQAAESLAFDRAKEELGTAAKDAQRSATYRSIARGNYRGGGINRAEQEITDNVNDQLRKFQTDLTIDQARRRTANQQAAIAQAAGIGSTQANLDLANRSQRLTEDQVYDVDGTNTVTGANSKTSRDAQIASITGKYNGESTLAGRAQQANEDQIYDVAGDKTVSGANAALSRDAQVAGITGKYDGEETVQGKLANSQLLNDALNRAIAAGSQSGKFVDPQTGEEFTTEDARRFNETLALQTASITGKYAGEDTLQGKQFEAEYGEGGFKERTLKVSELNAALNRAIAQGNTTGEFVDPETGMAQDTLQKELVIANATGYMPDGTPTLSRDEFSLMDKKFDLMLDDRNAQNITDFTQTLLTALGLGNDLTFGNDLQNWVRNTLGLDPVGGEAPGNGTPGQPGGNGGAVPGDSGGNGNPSGNVGGNSLVDDPEYGPLRTYLQQSGFSVDGLELVNSDGLTQTFKTPNGKTVQVRWSEDGSAIDAILDENGNLKGKMFGDKMVTGDNLWRGIKGQTALRVLGDLYFNGASPNTVGRLPKHLQSSIISSMSNLAIGNPYLALAASIGADQVLDKLGNIPEAEAFKTAAKDGDLSDTSTEQLIKWRDGFVMGMNPSGQNAWSVAGETRWNSQELMPYSAPLDYEITIRGFKAMEDGGFDVDGTGQSLATELSKRAGVSEADAWEAISRGYLKHDGDMGAMVEEFVDMGLMGKEVASQFTKANTANQNATGTQSQFSEEDFVDFRQAFAQSQEGNAFDSRFDLDKDKDVDFDDFTAFAEQIGGVNSVEGPGTASFGTDAPHGPTEPVGKIGNRTVYVDELETLSVEELRQLKSGAPSNWQERIDRLITQKANGQPATKKTNQPPEAEITGMTPDKIASKIIDDLGALQLSGRAKGWLNGSEGRKFVMSKVNERGADRARAEVERFLKTL